MFIRREMFNLVPRVCRVLGNVCYLHACSNKDYGEKKTSSCYTYRELAMHQVIFLHINRISCSSPRKRLLGVLFYVIYTERESVIYHGIKTPRSVLKNEAVGRFFLTTSRCFETVVKNYFEFFIYLLKRISI